jgi:hypothetical protein
VWPARETLIGSCIYDDGDVLEGQSGSGSEMDESPECWRNRPVMRSRRALFGEGC